MSMSGSISQPVSRLPRTMIARHGLHLVPDAKRVADEGQIRAGFVYRIAAVGAALFLAMTLH